MTDLIKQARELCASATPGPWKVEQKGNTVKSMAIKGVCCGMSAMRDDYHFIAASRTLVPALADALEKAEAERDEAVKTLEHLKQQLLEVTAERDALQKISSADYASY